MSQNGRGIEMPEIKAIQTEYNGYLFRSRLEARWAVFFDALHIEYQYEPEGFELGDGLRYLPDFWLPDYDCWLEIKGGQPNRDEVLKAKLLMKHSDQRVMIAFGDIWPSKLTIWDYLWTESTLKSHIKYVIDSREHVKEDLKLIAETFRNCEPFKYPKRDGEFIPATASSCLKDIAIWFLLTKDDINAFLISLDQVPLRERKLHLAFKAARQARFERLNA